MSILPLAATRTGAIEPPARQCAMPWAAAALLAVGVLVLAAPGAWAQLETPLRQGAAGQRAAAPRGTICTSLFLSDCRTPGAVQRNDDGPTEPSIGSIAVRTAPERHGNVAPPVTRRGGSASAAAPAGAAPAHPAVQESAAAPPPAPPPPDPVVANLDAVRTAIEHLGLQGAVSVERSAAGNDLLISFPAAPRTRH